MARYEFVASWAASANVRIVRGDIAAGEGVRCGFGRVESDRALGGGDRHGQSMYQIGRYTRSIPQGTALLFGATDFALKSPVKRLLLSSSRSIYGEGKLCLHPCSGCNASTRTRDAHGGRQMGAIS